MNSDNCYIQDNRKKVMFGIGERDYSVDVMRCISCLMVVTTHTCANIMATFSSELPIDIEGQWLAFAALKCITVSATNLFVMISGIFFLSPERNVSISKIWSKNILKLSVAYILWCAIYALLRIYYLTPRQLSWNIFFEEFMNREGHLWYIPMMLSIYVLVPLLRVFSCNAERKHYLYLIGLLVGAIMLNTINVFGNLYEYNGSDVVSVIIGNTPTGTICQYTFYCILGYFLYSYMPKLKTRICIYILGILGLLFMIWMTTFFYIEKGATDSLLIQDKFIIGTLAKNTALFIAVIAVFSKIEMSKCFKKVLSKLSSATLFIYLSHMVLLDVFMQTHWLMDSIGDKFLVGCIYIAVIYISGFLFSLIFLQMIPWTKMRNTILDIVWPNRRIWNGGRK